MARAAVLVWLLSMMLVSIDLVQGYGINWGAMATNPLPPKKVVAMLKENGFKKVKLFDADPSMMDALAGSGLEVMVGIPNDKLKSLANDYGNAKAWVKENVTSYLYDGGVAIKYVAVGNEPFLTSYNGSYVKTTYPAMQNIQKALYDYSKDIGTKIKVTTPFNADVYESKSDKPSDGRFRKDIKDSMVQILKFLKEAKSPFLVNIYPFLSLALSSDFPREFAFFDDGGNGVQDNNIQYKNVFDANLDTCYNALKQEGFQDLEIQIGEVGWPTDGNKDANIKLAQKFYDGLFKKLAKGEGTPLQKGNPEVYLFSLFDENTKSIAPGDFERHWGIFRYDGQPKFPMDLSGKGQNQMLKPVKGVEMMDKQWCVLNSDVKNLSKAQVEKDYACSNSDCTSIKNGSSCSSLEPHDQISYAFNSFYQLKNQSVEACNFNGMGTRVTEDPSKGDCLFLIQVESIATDMAALSFSTGLLLLMTFFALM
ncbi:putative glucan endo-1,3-beta-D-glucosidase [Rosa chinensis]|uniref:glucan endo-1,3-beta-D-glucosidase n=1 Tax=Rosa chinensis TaxID=74649 RepID=A0A2P6RRI7_ROSCH|nr:glucan endo-1,3-beta-glucosidase 8 [Rosa chinensis]PRQ49045.1 putative glucan endo-1,3-beta-D-glucosidase [Rosa chinensis]